MTTTERVTIPAGHGKAARLNAGPSLNLINTPGTRVVDFRAFDAYDLREYMCVEASRVWSMPRHSNYDADLDQLFATSANVGLWLLADIRRATPRGPLPARKQTFSPSNLDN